MVRKLFVMVVGLALLFGGAYTAARGFTARDEVQTKLAAQHITTTEDASIPDAAVDTAAEAQSMAEVIQKHVLEATEGQTYAQMDRYLAEGGGTTSDEEAALTDDSGNPVSNPLRSVALTGAELQTSLYSAVLAFNLADLVIGLGLALLSIGGAIVAIGYKLQ